MYLFKLDITQAYRPASVINLSSRILKDTEVRVLAKGMKYIPCPRRPPDSDIKNSIQKFSRQMQIINFFSEMGERPPCKFKIPSSWLPPTNEVDENLVEILKEMSNEIKKIKICNKQKPYSKREFKILQNLKKDHSIVFKPADKGSSIVIQNRENYIFEAEKQLSVPLHYEEIQEPKYPEVADIIYAYLRQIRQKKLITFKEYKFLTPPDSELGSLDGDQARDRRLYFLPKIHKNHSLWHNSIIPPHRPIVSDCSSDTYNLSLYLDYILSPLSTKHPSYIRDTTDFLNKLGQHKVHQNCYLITLDVESLYTNIDNKDGLEAVREILLEYPDPTRPDEEFLELLQICLENNDFQFNGRWFLQIWGTSMGRRFAPKYANIFMAHFEKRALAKCPNLPQAYFRFLDDIGLLWPHSLEAFYEFLNIFNSQHRTIKFKATISQQEINFLDVTIFKGPRFLETGILDTKVYFKPTDTHELLHRSSYHPRHTFKGVLKSQIMRYRKICNNDSDFENACDLLFSTLIHRGYSRSFIRMMKTRTLSPQVFNIQHKGGSKPCSSRNCQICPEFLNVTDFILDHKQNKHYLEHEMDCNTKNVIYAIQCLGCSKYYVGETSNELRTRFNNHKSEIIRGKDKPLASHFQECPELEKLNKLNTPFLKITPLEIVQLLPEHEIIIPEGAWEGPPHPNDGNRIRNHAKRIERESYWIRKLNTIKPNGLNRRKEAPGIIPFILTHCDQNKQIMDIVNKSFVKIKDTIPYFARFKLLAAFRRNKNIKEFLVSANLKQIESNPD